MTVFRPSFPPSRTIITSTRWPLEEVPASASRVIGHQTDLPSSVPDRIPDMRVMNWRRFIGSPHFSW
jgi:hypothetical protein